ncbi:glutathione synthetase ATP-binding domain-like protein [Aulographum hederae CBS 113979]|uniref:Glutathione synthetase ATP-binding domain-like protein n=1 Tax=Aulographum hederae CBS 113979 TaxID=1176131 RepID=A0A6G1H2X2_9PEZI|nr:glutathione synthetase ATP-binding domain-like protein [Aulographum hederae CBS 113979]
MAPSAMPVDRDQSSGKYRRVGLCFDLKEDYVASGIPTELVEGFEETKTINAITAALEKKGFHVIQLGNFKQLAKVLSDRDGKLYVDFVFNIHSGFYGTARESQVPAILEAYQIPFTGSNCATLAWCIDKAKTKMILESLQIPTAPFLVIPAVSKRDPALSTKALYEHAMSTTRHKKQLSKFPLFLKPVSQGCSVGVSASNKVTNQERLHEELDYLSCKFPNDDIVVETFLPGREFTVGIIGTGHEARCLGAIEFNYSPRGADGFPDFYSSGRKAVKTSAGMETQVPSDKDSEANAVKEVALRAWRALDCRDGGRVDVRCDENGVPHILELQPLSGLRPDISGLPLIAYSAGISYDELICMIVEAAIGRFKRMGELSTKLVEPKLNGKQHGKAANAVENENGVEYPRYDM